MINMIKYKRCEYHESISMRKIRTFNIQENGIARVYYMVSKKRESNKTNTEKEIFL